MVLKINNNNMRNLEQVINEGKAIIEMKDNYIDRLRDQNTEYLNKITSDHKELVRLRGDLKYIDKCNAEMRNHIDDIELENRHLKVLSKVFLALYIISVIASLLIIRFI